MNLLARLQLLAKVSTPGGRVRRRSCRSLPDYITCNARVQGNDSVMHKITILCGCACRTPSSRWSLDACRRCNVCWSSYRSVCAWCCNKGLRCGGRAKSPSAESIWELSQAMLAGCGAFAPLVPCASHPGQSTSHASTEKQPCCFAASSLALRRPRVWQITAQRFQPSAQQSQLTCCRSATRRRRATQQTAATLTADRPTESRASSAASARDSSNTARENTDTEQRRLPQYDPAHTNRLDLVVAGGGPAGLAVAERVSAAGYQVIICPA